MFGTEGGKRLADHFSLPLLARIPLAPALRERTDAGTPLVIAEPSHPVSTIFRGLAERIAADLRAGDATHSRD
jgi:ATP-binding protein involved in chromosome partitioning